MNKMIVNFYLFSSLMENWIGSNGDQISYHNTSSWFWFHRS